jgi:hypothetical protein
VTRNEAIFNTLYLASFAVLIAWFLLLVVGLFVPTVMSLANRIAIPTLLISIVSMETFKRLAAKARKEREVANG